LIGAAGAVWAALHHEGLVRMALWTSLGIFVQPAIFFLATIRQDLCSFFSPRLIRMTRALEFSRFCSAALVAQISGLFIAGLDLPIVAAWDFSNAGYYAIAIIVSNMLTVPYGAVLSTLVPIISSRSAEESPESMGRVTLRTTRLSTGLLLWIAIPLMIGMPLLLRLWVGKEYALNTLLLGEVLLGANLVRLTLMPYSTVGFSAGEQNKMLVSPGVEGAVNVAFSLLLVRSMGATGVAVGTLIGSFFGVGLHFWNSMAYTRSMSFKKTDLLFQGILQPLAWSLPVAIVCAVLFFLTGSIGIKLLVLAAAVAALAFVFWKAVLKSEDRTMFRLASGHLLPFSPRAEG
jgi:O-antigen/teichoic acid export membrane protein